MSSPEGTISLNFSALQSAETQLGGTLSTLRARLEQLESELSPLVHSWTGEAQAAYLIQKKRWERAADDLARMLGGIVTGLGNTNSDYTSAQRSIVAAFS